MTEETQESADISTNATISENISNNDNSTELESPSELTTANEAQNDKPIGYEPVNLATASPEEVQSRINYLYKQVKNSDGTIKEYRSLAEQQARLIAELQQGQMAITNHLTQQNINDVETSLKQQYKDAYAAGDTEALSEINDKLLEIKLQKKELAAQSKQPIQQQQQQLEQPEPLIPVEEFRALAPVMTAWQEERDARGVPIRPWSQDSHPDFVVAEAITKSIFTSPQYQHLTAQQKLAEVDKRMGVNRNQGGQTVLGGRLTTPTKGSKITLSEEQKKIAIKTKFGSNKGAKSDSEYIEMYKKQIESVNKKTNRS